MALKELLLVPGINVFFCFYLLFMTSYAHPYTANLAQSKDHHNVL